MKPNTRPLFPAPRTNPSKKDAKMRQLRSPYLVYFEDVNPDFPLLWQQRSESIEKCSGEEPETICLKKVIELWSFSLENPGEASGKYDELCETVGKFQHAKGLETVDAACPGQGIIGLPFLQALVLKTIYEVKSEWLLRAEMTFTNAIGVAYHMGLHELELKEKAIRHRWNDPTNETELEEARRVFWFLVHIDCWRCIIHCRPRLIGLEESIPDLPASDADFYRTDPDLTARGKGRPNVNITFKQLINTEASESAFEVLPGNSGTIEPRDVSYLAYQSAALHFLAKNQSGMTQEARQEAILRLDFFRRRLRGRLSETQLANDTQARLTIALICTGQFVLSKSIEAGNEKNHDLLEASFETYFRDVLCPDPQIPQYPWICFAYQIAMIWLLEREPGDRTRLKFAECWENEDDSHAFKKLIGILVDHVKYAASVILPAFSSICANPFLWSEAKPLLPEAMVTVLEKQYMKQVDLIPLTGQIDFDGSTFLPDDISMYGQTNEAFTGVEEAMIFPTHFFTPMADFSGAQFQPGHPPPVMMSPSPYAPPNHLMNSLHGLQNGICGPAFSPQPMPTYWPANPMDTAFVSTGMPVHTPPAMPYSPPIMMQAQQALPLPPQVGSVESASRSPSRHVRIMPRLAPMPDNGILSASQSVEGTPTSSSFTQLPPRPVAGQGRTRKR